MANRYLSLEDSAFASLRGPDSAIKKPLGYITSERYLFGRKLLAAYQINRTVVDRLVQTKETSRSGVSAGIDREVGYFLDFNNTSGQHVDVPLNIGTVASTFFMAVRCRSSVSNAAIPIAELNLSAGSRLLAYFSSNRLILFTAAQSNIYTSSTNSGWTDGNWHWITIGYNQGGTGSIRRDGVVQGGTLTQPTGFIPTNTTFGNVFGKNLDNQLDISDLLIFEGTIDARIDSLIRRHPYAWTKPADKTPYLVSLDAGSANQIAVTTGAITIAGVNAGISQQNQIAVTTGAVVIAGVNASIGAGQEIAVTTGAVAIAAANAGIEVNRNVAVTTGALTIAKVNAGIEVNRNVSVTTGVITIAGVNAVVDQQTAGATTIVVTTGAVTITGTAAVINQVANLSVTTGAIVLTGINAAVNQERQVSATTGALAIAGVNAGIESAASISVTTGAINIAGVNATVTNVSGALADGIGQLKATPLSGFTARSIN